MSDLYGLLRDDNERERDESPALATVDPLADLRAPDDIAAERRVAEEVGEPSAAIRAYPELFSQRAEANQRQRSTRSTPRFAQWLDEPGNLDVARDDIEALSAMERLGDSEAAVVRWRDETKDYFTSQPWLRPLRGLVNIPSGLARPIARAIDGSDETLQYYSAGQDEQELLQLERRQQRAFEGLGEPLNDEEADLLANLREMPQPEGGIPIVREGLRQVPLLEGMAGRVINEFQNPRSSAGLIYATPEGQAALRAGRADPRLLAEGRFAEYGFDAGADAARQAYQSIGSIPGSGAVTYVWDMEAAGVYRAAIEQGVPPEIAADAAEQAGALNAAVEIWGASLILGRSGIDEAAEGVIGREAIRRVTLRQALSRAGIRTAEAGVIGAAEEGIQETFSIMAEGGARARAGVEAPEDLGIAERYAESIRAGMEGGVALGGPVTSANLYFDMRAIRRGEQNQQAFADLVQSANASRLRERLPSAAASAVDASVAGTPIESIRIAADGFVEHFQGQRIDPGAAAEQVGVSREELAQALASGGDIQVRTGAFYAHFAASEQRLLRHARWDARDFTQAEIEGGAQERVETQVREMVEEAAKKTDEGGELGTFVEGKLRELFSAAENEGGYRPEVSRRYAQMAAALPRAMVARARAVDPAYADKLEQDFRTLFAERFDIAGPGRDGGFEGASVLPQGTPEQVQRHFDYLNDILEERRSLSTPGLRRDAPEQIPEVGTREYAEAVINAREAQARGDKLNPIQRSLLKWEADNAFPEGLFQGPRSLREALSLSDEDVVAWFNENVEVRRPNDAEVALWFKTEDGLKRPNVRLTIDYDGTAITSFRGRTDQQRAWPTAKDVKKAAQIFVRLAAVTRAWVLINKPERIVFTGATQAHEKLYRSMLRMADFPGYVSQERETLKARAYKATETVTPTRDATSDQTSTTIFSILRADVAAQESTSEQVSATGAVGAWWDDTRANVGSIYKSQSRVRTLRDGRSTDANGRAGGSAASGRPGSGANPDRGNDGTSQRPGDQGAEGRLEQGERRSVAPWIAERFSQEEIDSWLALINDPNATPDQILSHPIQTALEAEAGPPTFTKETIAQAGALASRVYRIDGQEFDAPGYIAHMRAKFEAEVGAPLQQNRVAVIVTGQPGAGKSTTRAGLASMFGAVSIDLDELRAGIPEYEAGKGSSRTTQVEAGELRRILLDQVLAEGQNALVEMVGKSQADILGAAAHLQENGYTVALANVSVSYDNSVRRYAKRTISGGRWVHADFIRVVADEPSAIFGELVAEGSLSGYIQVDGNGPQGSEKVTSAQGSLDGPALEAAIRSNRNRPGREPDRLDPARADDGSLDGQGNEGGLSEAAQAGARGSIRYENFRPGEFGSAMIRMGKSSDLSTFLHEFGHLGHLVLESVATDPKAPAEFRAMWDNTLQWWGLSQEQWSALSQEQKTPYFEQWARTFEAYLMEGKAPSLSLREAFAAFKAWLTQIYRSVFRLDANLNPQIRDVFDRMLATDQEMAEARAEMGADFKLAREAFKTDEEFQQYIEAIATARDAQDAELRARVMDRFVRKEKRWWRSERERVRNTAIIEVDTDPARRALEWIAFNEWRALPVEQNEDGVELPQDASLAMPEGLPEMRLDMSTLDEADRAGLPEGLAPLASAEDAQAALDSAMALKRQGRTRQPQRLWSFIKAQGGIKDEGGEITQALGSARSRPGLINNTSGIDADTLALRAWEAGYFGAVPRQTLNQSDGPDAGPSRIEHQAYVNSLRDQGFDVDGLWFHGTQLEDGADIAAFDLSRAGTGKGTANERAVWLADSGANARPYAKTSPYRNAAIYPVYVRGRMMRFDADGRTYDWSGWVTDTLDRARAEGYDGVVFENMREPLSGGGDQLAVFDPKNIAFQFGRASPDGGGARTGRLSEEGAGQNAGQNELVRDFVRGDPDWDAWRVRATETATENNSVDGPGLMRAFDLSTPDGARAGRISIRETPDAIYIDGIMGGGRRTNGTSARGVPSRAVKAIIVEAERRGIPVIATNTGGAKPGYWDSMGFRRDGVNHVFDATQAAGVRSGDINSTYWGHERGYGSMYEEAYGGTLPPRAQPNAGPPQGSFENFQSEAPLIYHGSAKPLNGIRPILFATPDKPTAAFFARLDRKETRGMRRVTPLQPNLSNPMHVSANGGLITAMGTDRELWRLVEQAQAAGNDAIIVHNVVDGPAMDIRSVYAEPIDVYIILDPKKVEKLPADYIDASPMVQGLLRMFGSFQLFQGETAIEAVRARVENAPADVPRNDIPLEQVRVAYPKADAARMSARLADQDGELTTSWGATLQVRAGLDMIVGEAQGEGRPVRKDIFDQTYEEVAPGEWAKRSDVPVGFVTLTAPQTINTLEGAVPAEAGDVVLIGAIGEMWPIRADKFAQRYDVSAIAPQFGSEAASDAAAAYDTQGRRPTPRELLDALIDDIKNVRQVYSSKDEAAVAAYQNRTDAIRWFEARGVDLSGTKEEIRSQIMDALNAEAEQEAGGWHPDDIAPWFGFSSGDELIQALKGLKPRAVAIEENIERRLEDQYGDPLKDGTVAEAAALAGHIEAQSKRIEIELAAIQRATGGRVTPVGRAARAYAERQVQHMTVKQIRGFDTFLAGERRAARNAMEATQKKKFDDAALWKSRQLISFHLYRLARDASEEMDVAQRYFQKFDRDTIRAKIHAPLLDQIDQALEGIDLRAKPRISAKKRQSFLNWYNEMVAEGLTHQLAVDPDFLAEVQNKPFNALTLEEARGIRDAVRNFEHIGRRWREVLGERDARLLDESVAAMAASMAEVKPFEIANPADHSAGIVESIDRKRQAAHAHLSRVEPVARAMDRNKDNGPVWNALFRPLTEARDREEVRQQQAQADIERLFSVYTAEERADMWVKRKYYPQVPNRDGSRMGRNFTKQEILALALNTGNEYNLAALLEGESKNSGMTETQLRALLDAAMTKRDWEFVQAAWDYVDSFWPAIEALYIKSAGVAPAKVQATPFRNRYGEWRGGYWHLEYDYGRDQRVRDEMDFGAVQEAFGGFRARTQTPNGFSKARQGSGGRPVRLELSILTEHVNEVIHDLEFRMPVLNVWRLIKHSGFRDAFVRAAGQEMYDTLKPWLQYTATERMPPERMFAGVIKTLRRNTPIALMGYAVGTIAQQPAGIMATFHRVGTGRVMAKLMELSAQPWRWMDHARFINARSAFMRNYATISQRELREMVAESNSKAHIDAVRLLTRGTASQKVQALGYINRSMQRFAMFPLAFVNKWVASAAWQAAYEKALAGKVEGVSPNNEADVVAYADQMIRTTFGSGRPEDLPGVMRSSEIEKMLTPAFSYFSTQYQAMFNEQLPGMMRGQISPIEFTTFVLWTLVIQALASQWLAGRWEPDDDESEEERNLRLAMEVATVPAAGIPLVRDMTRAVTRVATTGEVQSFNSVPALGALSATGTGIGGTINDLAEEGEISRRSARDLTMASGYWFGLPSRQMWTTGSYLSDVASGDEELPWDAEDPVDATSEALLRDTR